MNPCRFRVSQAFHNIPLRKIADCLIRGDEVIE